MSEWETEGRNFMGASGQVISLAVSVFQALGEFFGTSCLNVHWPYNIHCSCYEKKKEKIST